MAKPDEEDGPWVAEGLTRSEWADKVTNEIFWTHAPEYMRQKERLKAERERQAKVREERPKGEVLPLRLAKREAVVLEFPPKRDLSGPRESAPLLRGTGGERGTVKSRKVTTFSQCPRGVTG
jgi:hypothetical protein